MAREHARVKLSIWEDDEFRALSSNAQRLYFVLMTSMKLDYCGVTDWRPARIAPLCSDWSVADVERAGSELADALFVVIDEATEEILLRTFVRHDGLLEQPNMAVAMRKAYGSISSTPLRQVIVHELVRLHADKPSLKGWDRLDDLLSKPSRNPSATPLRKGSPNPSIDPSPDPSQKGKPNPSANPSPDPSPTTAPNSSSSSSTPKKTSSPSDGPRKRGSRIPEDWRPTEDDLEWQRREGVSDFTARREAAKFVDYWRAKAGKDATKLDWSATWRNWLRRAQDSQPTVAANGFRPNPWSSDPLAPMPPWDEFGTGKA